MTIFFEEVFHFAVLIGKVSLLLFDGVSLRERVYCGALQLNVAGISVHGIGDADLACFRARSY